MCVCPILDPQTCVKRTRERFFLSACALARGPRNRPLWFLTGVWCGTCCSKARAEKVPTIKNTTNNIALPRHIYYIYIDIFDNTKSSRRDQTGLREKKDKKGWTGCRARHHLAVPAPATSVAFSSNTTPPAGGEGKRERSTRQGVEK